ncbi:hypothetical protein [Bosea sp. MMO-172]|uniref:hypothetical protein n=1 Tax=Bosea sp. MMO-172 TaxID=3127885 RepID=UPI003018F8F6
MPPLPANDYAVEATDELTPALWNAVFASIAARLAAREALEATFQALITEGTQAALDVISQNVAPQLENLLESVADLRQQVEEVIGDGNAPNALKLGGELPEFYLALANATGTLPYNKVVGIDAAIAAAVAAGVAGLVNSAPGALDTIGELAAALLNDPNAISGILTALGNRLRFDAAQALTGPQLAQVLANLGSNADGRDIFKNASAFGATWAKLANADAARAALGLGYEFIGYQKLPAAAASINFVTNVGNYVNLRAVGKIISVTGGGAPCFRLSKDAGASWLSGATDYFGQVGYFAGGGYAAGTVSQSYSIMSGAAISAGFPTKISLELTGVNENGPTHHDGRSTWNNNGGAVILDFHGGQTNSAGANAVHNGIQFFSNVGQLAAGSYIFLYGQRTPP